MCNNFSFNLFEFDVIASVLNVDVFSTISIIDLMVIGIL